MCKLLIHVSAAKRKVGLIFVLLALAATWLLPTLHAPCEPIDDRQETGCSCKHDEHERDTSPTTRHTHDGHNEQDCGLCQIMFLGTVGTSPTNSNLVCCGPAPMLAVISQVAQCPDSIARPRHLAARGPPAG